MDDRDIARLMRLENRLRASVSVNATAKPCAAGVYFIGGDDTPIKIGFSTVPAMRLESLQTGHWAKLSILAIAPGTLADEAAYHRRFAASRLHGEWFTRTPEIEAEIARLTAKDLAA